MHKLDMLPCVLAALLCSTVLPGHGARAYQCDFQSIENTASGAEAVFLGEIIWAGSLPHDLNSSRKLTFRVLTSWKGVTGTEVGVFDTCPWFCGWDVGDQFVVYAWLRQADGVLCVDHCVMNDPGGARCGEEHIPTLDSLYNPIELTEGPDPRFPPHKPRDAAHPQERSLCGVGLPGMALLLGPILAALHICRRS